MKPLWAKVCDGVHNWCWTRGGRSKMNSSKSFLLLSLAAAILLWWLHTTKGRWSLEFLYSAELVRCWAMTHSLGLVCVPVPDDGLGRQCPSNASDLASKHNILDDGSLPC